MQREWQTAEAVGEPFRVRVRSARGGEIDEYLPAGTGG